MSRSTAIMPATKDEDSIVLRDEKEAKHLSMVRFILGKLPAAYGNKSPVAFTVTVDDNGEIVVPPAARAVVTGDRLININTADALALTDLCGIGPKIAESIVAKQPFTSVDELKDVDGIGEAKLRSLKPFITI